LKLQNEEEVNKQHKLIKEQNMLKEKIENFEKEKLEKRKNSLKIKEIELMKTKSDIESQLRELEKVKKPEPQAQEVKGEGETPDSDDKKQAHNNAAASHVVINPMDAKNRGKFKLEHNRLDFEHTPRPLSMTDQHPDAALFNPALVQLNAKNAKLNPLVSQILKITGLCIEDMSNLTHRMLHVDQFPMLHTFIKEHPLNLTMANRRCENQYGGLTKCEPYLGTMSVKKCPSGYMRIGCCQCVIPCPRGYWPDGGGLFCFKSDPVKGKKYNSYAECINDKAINRECELYGVSFFTKACPQNYERNGDLLCMQRCPLGWPDYGLKCLKVGNIRTGMPTVWQPGDEEYGPDKKPIEYYKEGGQNANEANLQDDEVKLQIQNQPQRRDTLEASLSDSKERRDLIKGKNNSETLIKPSKVNIDFGKIKFTINKENRRQKWIKKERRAQLIK